MIVILAWLATLCLRSGMGGRPASCLTWAATLTWTLLLNVYVPIYDAPLVALAVILTLGAISELGWNDVTGWLVFLALLVFAASWNTESIAQKYGLQPLTILLLILALGQLLLLEQAVRSASTQTGSEALSARAQA